MVDYFMNAKCGSMREEVAFTQLEFGISLGGKLNLGKSLSRRRTEPKPPDLKPWASRFQITRLVKNERH
jgi:hypothetical protein